MIMTLIEMRYEVKKIGIESEMKLIRIYYQVLDHFMPYLAARSVYNHMARPKIYKLKNFEENVLSEAKQEKIPFKDIHIQTYKWGDETNKSIFLVHGWEGQAGNFASLIEMLLSKNYHIISFDAPSHGKSTIKKTHLFEFAEFLPIMLNKYKPSSIVSHSFGSVNTMIALNKNPNIHLDQWFIITTWSDFNEVFNQIIRRTGISQRTLRRLSKMMEDSSDVKFYRLNMQKQGRDLNTVKDVTIVHSKSDKVIPLEESRIAHNSIKGSTLFELDNLGHYKILGSDELKVIINDRLK